MNLTSELIDFIKDHEDDDIPTLSLRAGSFPHIDIQQAIRQIAGRKIAKTKLPLWYNNDNILYPLHISLEQCSSEQAARYKASLVSGDSMIDLTGGLGVDFSFFATKFKEAVYIELQEELAMISVHNFNALGLENVIVKNINSIEYLHSIPSSVDFLYIDPARRNNIGKKTVLIEDCTPNILDIEELLEEKSRHIMIKLSPMLDISLAVKSLKNVSDVHIVSINNECKELLFIKNNNKDRETLYHCVNISGDVTDKFSFYRSDEDSLVTNYTSDLGKYLYEPNTSILKAGAYKSIGEKYSVNKFHPSSHLYTSDQLFPDFHGRKFIIESICSLSKKDIKTSLRDIKQANITTRNFPISVQEIRKKTGIKEGGDLYIFATTLADNRYVLILCRKV